MSDNYLKDLCPRVWDLLQANMEAGAKRYPENDWDTRYTADQYTDKANVHYHLFVLGQKNDPDNGIDHRAHALCDIILALELRLREEGE